MNESKTPLIIGAVAVAALLLGGWLWFSSQNQTSTSPSPTVSTETSTSPQAQATQNIVELASANPEFSTLVTAIKSAGLLETLSPPGPYTVFAPTNDAFAKLPAGTLDNLLKNPEQLKSVLTYHVVAGNVKAADVVKLTSATTVNGKEVPITVSGEIVKVGPALVTKTDIAATNGTIHVIDTVLVP